MSKDLAIAGVMVVSCLVVSAIAFVPPAKDTKTAPGPAIAAHKPVDLAPRPVQPAQPVQPSPVEPPPRPAGLEPITPLPFETPKPAPSFPPPQPGPATPVVTKQPVIELPAPSLAGEPKTHVVAKGEMLGDISLHYYGTSKRWQEIAKANPGIDPNGLQVGQKLTIPADTHPVTAAATPSQPAQPAAPGERTYTVKDGDRYYTIAQRELGDPSRWKELETLNKTPSEELRVGQVIKLPAKKDAVTPLLPATGEHPAATVDDGKKRHTVVEGDSLGEISMKYYGTSKRWKEIEKANPGIDSDRLMVGQKLIIPDAPAEAPKPAPTPTAPGTPATAAGGDVTEYVVKAGDTLTAIADRFYHDKDKSGVERIQKANPGIDPHGLRVGQKLKIPGVKPEAPKPAPAAPAPTKPANPFAPTAPSNPAPTNSAPNPFAPSGPTAPNGPNQATPRPPANPFAPGAAPTSPAKPGPATLPPSAPKPTTPPAPGAAKPTTPPAPGAAKPNVPAVPGPAKPTTPTAGKPAGGTDPFAIDPLQPAPTPAEPGAPAAGKPSGTPDDPFKDFFAR